MHQLGLFDDLPEPTAAEGRRGPIPAPAAPGSEIASLAARLDPRLRLGTSSWSFPGWAGLVYAGPESTQALSRQGLAAYSRHPLLRTVAVDSGFYAPLDARRLAGYADQTPADFRFLVKAPALITDAVRRDARGRALEPNPGFLDPVRAAELAVGPYVEGLGERAGVLLFQFPPLGRPLAEAPRRFAEDLYRFLRRLPTGPVYAVEVRDSALLTPDLAAALHHGGAVPGLAVHPRLPPIGDQLAWLAAGPEDPDRRRPLILRWLLRRNRGYREAQGLYQPFDRLAEPDPATRAALAGAIGAALAAGRECLVIANNKAEGSAPLTLAALARAVVGSAR